MISSALHARCIQNQVRKSDETYGLLNCNSGATSERSASLLARLDLGSNARRGHFSPHERPLSPFPFPPKAVDRTTWLPAMVALGRIDSINVCGRGGIGRSIGWGQQHRSSPNSHRLRLAFFASRVNGPAAAGSERRHACSTHTPVRVWADRSIKQACTAAMPRIGRCIVLGMRRSVSSLVPEPSPARRFPNPTHHRLMLTPPLPKII